MLGLNRGRSTLPIWPRPLNRRPVTSVPFLAQSAIAFLLLARFVKSARRLVRPSRVFRMPSPVGVAAPKTPAIVLPRFLKMFHRWDAEAKDLSILARIRSAKPGAFVHRANDRATPRTTFASRLPEGCRARKP